MCAFLILNDTSAPSSPLLGGGRAIGFLFFSSFHVTARAVPPLENNQNNFGTFSVKTANSFGANFNEEQVVGRKSIIDSATSPFETAPAGNRSGSSNNNSLSAGMAATMGRNMDGEWRHHQEDTTNHANNNNNNIHHYNNNNGSSNGVDGYGSENERKAKLVIGTDVSNLDPVSSVLKTIY